MGTDKFDHMVTIVQQRERHSWTCLSDLAKTFDEDQLVTDFAAFKAVRDAKLAIRSSQGFFSPFVPPHLAGAKGKTKCGKKGKSSFRRNGFGEGKQSMSGPRQRHDERRHFQGSVQVPMAAVCANVVCWSCGERGHFLCTMLKKETRNKFQEKELRAPLATCAVSYERKGSGKG